MSRLIAIGGGKGGVGKSVITLGLGTALAHLGHKVTLVDLDLGGSNLHTLLGFRKTLTGVGLFLSENLSTFDGLTVPGGADGIDFIPGTGLIPGIAGSRQKDKRRILSALKKHPSDFVLLDLGAGTSRDSVDFFLWSDVGIIVTAPIPSSILNAYEFLKNAVYRQLGTKMSSERFVKSVLEHSKSPGSGLALNTISQLSDCVKDIDPAASEKILSVCASMKVFLIANMMGRNESGKMSEKLSAIAKQFLSVDLGLIGEVPHDAHIEMMIRNLLPLTLCPRDGAFFGALFDAAKRTSRLVAHRSEKASAAKWSDFVRLEREMVKRSADSTRLFMENMGSGLEGDDTAHRETRRPTRTRQVPVEQNLIP